VVFSEQVVQIVGAAVLARDDVVDLKLGQVVLLSDAAVLASAVGAPPHLFDR
jgi:hypothetical protein